MNEEQLETLANTFCADLGTGDFEILLNKMAEKLEKESDADGLEAMADILEDAKDTVDEMIEEFDEE